MDEVTSVSRPRLPGVSPWKLGLTIIGVLLVVFIIWETAFDSWPELARRAEAGALARQPEGVLRDFRIAIVHVLLVGYLPAALLAVLRGGRRTVLELQEALDCTREECAALAASVRLDRGKLLGAGFVGLLFGIGIPYITPPVPDALWDPRTWSPEVAWHRILGPTAAILAGCLFYAVVSVSRRMSRLAADLTSVDLMKLRPLQPFTRHGLTNALIVLAFVSIGGLMVITEEGFGLLGLFFAFVTLIVSGSALLLPLRGVHSRIIETKKSELSWVNEQIGQRRRSLRSGASSDRPGELADLAAYRDLVADVPDWPLSTSSYARFALYLLIPLLSWAAAALVERFVNVLISG